MSKRSNRSTKGAKKTTDTETKLPGWMRNIARRVKTMIKNGIQVILLIKGKIRVGLACKAKEVADTILEISRKHQTKAIQIVAA